MSSNLRGRPSSAGLPRTPLLRPADLNEERAALHAEIAGGPRRQQSSQTPLTDAEERLLGPFGLMLIAPRVGSAVQSLGSALRFEDSLPARVRELGILVVARHRNSEFEWYAHENAALAAGITMEQLQCLLDGQIPAGLDAQEELVIDVVKRLLQDGQLDDDCYARAVSVLSLEMLAVIVWLVGYYDMLATALATFRPPMRGEE